MRNAWGTAFGLFGILLACQGGGGEGADPLTSSSSSSSSGGNCPTKRACSGTPLTCTAQNSGLECRSVKGCLWEGAQDKLRCKGTATFCEDLTTEDECGAQKGCSWNASAPCPTPSASSSSSSSSPSGSTPTAGACEGTLQACTTIITESCSSQPLCASDPNRGGCAADTSSIPGPPSCSALKEEQCLHAIGCSHRSPDGTTREIEFGTCGGEAVPCSTITSETECNAQPFIYPGNKTCTWDSGTCKASPLNAPCSTFDAPRPPANATPGSVHHPDFQKSRCTARKGCVWQPTSQ